MLFDFKDILQYFKFENWRIGEFVFWCHEQVILQYFLVAGVWESLRQQKSICLSWWVFFLKIIQILLNFFFHQITCSWHQKTNSPVLQFTNLKCCIKGKEPFKTPFELENSFFYVTNRLYETNLGAHFLLFTFFTTKMMPYFWQLAINPKLKIQ